MIFKDYKQWPSKEQEGEYNALLKLFENFIGMKVTDKISLRLVWSDNRIRYNRKAKIDDKPGGGAIRHQWTCNGINDEGKKTSTKHVFVYALNYNVSPDLKLTNFEPKITEFNGNMTFGYKDLEFLLWLFMCFPGLEGGLNNDPKNKLGNMCKFDLPHIKEKAESELNKLEAKVQTLIYDRDLGLSIDKLKLMAAAYFIPDVDSRKDEEIENALKRLVIKGRTDKEKIESMELFISRTKDDDGMKARYLIGKAIEKKMVEWSPKNRKYYLVVDGKTMDNPLTPFIKLDEDPKQVLYESLIATPEGKDTLKLIESSFAVKEKPKGKVADEPQKSDDDKK